VEPPTQLRAAANYIRSVKYPGQKDRPAEEKERLAALTRRFRSLQTRLIMQLSDCDPSSAAGVFSRRWLGRASDAVAELKLLQEDAERPCPPWAQRIEPDPTADEAVRRFPMPLLEKQLRQAVARSLAIKALGGLGARKHGKVAPGLERRKTTKGGKRWSMVKSKLDLGALSRARVARAEREREKRAQDAVSNRLARPKNTVQAGEGNPAGTHPGGDESDRPETEPLSGADRLTPAAMADTRLSESFFGQEDEPGEFVPRDEPHEGSAASHPPRLERRGPARRGAVRRRAGGRKRSEQPLRGDDNTFHDRTPHSAKRWNVAQKLMAELGGSGEED
jgi:hypothetical protein